MFERDLGGFDHQSILCEIMDSKFGPIAFAKQEVWLSNGIETPKHIYAKGDEIEMTEGEISDAEKILTRINKN